VALSILNLFVEPGTAAVLTVWRDVVNADTVVAITVDPAMAGLSAVAFTDGAGADFGRVDITVPGSATAGAYTWSIEIDSVPIWEGQIFIAQNARNSSYTSHSIDLRSETSPPINVPRAEDIVDPDAAGGPATQIDETGGPDTLDIAAIPDGFYLQRVGTDIVGSAAVGESNTTSNAGATGTGIALAKVGADLPIAKILGADGITESLAASVLTVSGAGLLDLAGTRTMTGNIVFSGAQTVDGRDISADWTTTSGHIANMSNPHSVTAAQAGAIATTAKAAANGVASLDASSIVVQPAQAIRTTTGPTTLTVGAVADGEYLVRSGTTLIGGTPSGSGAVNYVLTADRSVTITEADVTGWTGITLTASKLYRYTMHVSFSNDTASSAMPGIGLFFTNAPVGYSGLFYGMVTASTDSDRAMDVGVVGSTGTVSSSGVIYPIFISGTFKANATPGTFKIRSSTSGANTSTLYAGSYLTLEQLD